MRGAVGPHESLRHASQHGDMNTASAVKCKHYAVILDYCAIQAQQMGSIIP